MIKIFNESVFRKVIVGLFATFISVSFAAISINAEVDARLRGKINSGNENVSSFYDTGKLKVGTTIDNVKATLSLSRSSLEGSDTTFVTFDSFSLEVLDLFSGLLHMQFFHWNFEETPEASSDVQILSDIKYVGTYFKINPVDIFSFGFGYGAKGFMGLKDGVKFANSTTVAHAIKTNFSFGGPVPIGIFLGATLVQGSTVDLTPKPADNNNQAAATTGEENTVAHETGRIKVGLDRLQMGVSAKLYKSWINAYAGLTLPKGGAVSYLKSPTEAVVKESFIYTVGIDGDVPIMDTGVSIAYYLFYISQDFAKSLPNPIQSELTGVDDYTLKFNISPSYSLGLVKFSLGIDVFMEEKWIAVAEDSITMDPKEARNALMKANVLGDYISGDVKPSELVKYVYTSKKRNPLGMALEPKLTLTFAPGISVDFLYNLGVKDLTDRAEGVDKAALTHTVGMNVKAKFGYTTE